MYKNSIFICDNFYSDSERQIQTPHPIIIAGVDNKYFYCFIITSQIKNITKNDLSRNDYNTKIRYIKINDSNFINGLIDTSNCFTIPIDKINKSLKIDSISPELTNEIITKWAYQQNEIKDKQDYNYQQTSATLGITDCIKTTTLYQNCTRLMKKHYIELQHQKDYAKNLRIYKETCQQIRRENITRHYSNKPLLSLPKEPILETTIEQPNRSNYNYNNPFINLINI